MSDKDIFRDFDEFSQLNSIYISNVLTRLILGCRRDATRVCCSAPAPVDRYLRQGAQQQTRRPPLLLSIDGTDRRSDGWTPDLHIDPASHTLQAVSVMGMIVRTEQLWETKVCRYNRHSAGSLGWPFLTLKYKYIFQL